MPSRAAWGRRGSVVGRLPRSPSVPSTDGRSAPTAPQLRRGEGLAADTSMTCCTPSCEKVPRYPGTPAQPVAGAPPGEARPELRLEGQGPGTCAVPQAASPDPERCRSGLSVSMVKHSGRYLGELGGNMYSRPWNAGCPSGA